jgi:hypothetical protein
VTSGKCSVDGDDQSAIYSGAHMVDLDTDATVSFLAAFWPTHDDGSVSAKLIIDGGMSVDMQRFESSH